MELSERLYNTFINFNYLSLDRQGELVNQFAELIDRVSDGAWQQYVDDVFVWSQCAFCCRSPENGHDHDCPVALAKNLKDLENPLE
jgi:hypothetical protein